MSTRHAIAPLAALLLLMACAQERPPVDRVQPNVIQKADLEGEWFYQQTIIDMDSSANYSLIGDNAFWSMERVRWDVQEDVIYARRSFEWVENSETTNFELSSANGRAVGATTTQNGEPFQGAVVAAYRIERHFDIRREYNPTTGEELNVITENASDRPWHEREYMRVDWSTNLATDYDFDYFYFAGGELEVESIPFYVQENGPEHLRPAFDYEEEQLNYFDFVQQIAVRPSQTYLEGMGVIPTCWFFAHAGVDCSSTTLTVRASFLRTNDAEEDFEAMEFNGEMTDMFGIWTMDRMRYDHREGFREQNRRRFAQIHNIWERSHTDASCQADDECSAAGSRCDLNLGVQPRVCTLPWAETHFDESCDGDDDCALPGSRCEAEIGSERRQCTIPDVAQHGTQTCTVDSECAADTRCLSFGQCTIPYAERSPKPVVFYLTGGWPEDLENNGMWSRLEAEFDWALRRSVGAAQGMPDVDATCAAGACPEGRTCETEGRFAGQCVIPVRQMFHICHSPVRTTDAEACGPTGRVARFGDIRYNQLHYTREWSPLAPLGQAPTAPDPLSGRIFGMTISLYDSIDALSHRLLEWALLLNGRADPTGFIDGVDLSQFVDRMAEESTTEARERRLSQDQIREMYRARSNDWMRNLRDGRHATPPPARHAHEVMPQLLRQLRSTGAFDGQRNTGPGFLQSLQGTPIESLLMNDEMLMAGGYAPGTPLTDEVLSHASLLSSNHRNWRQAQERWFQNHNARRNLHYADLTWVPYEGMAREIRDMDEEEAFQYVRRRVWEGTIVHELGHAMGLYHNFAGSEDVLNFPEEWWSARTDGFTREIHSRFEDPVTESEIENGLIDQGYSSVMDYGSNYATGEALGRYDRAALLFSYGRSIEVFDELPEQTDAASVREWWSSTGQPLLLGEERPFTMHYSEIYNTMGRAIFTPENRRLVPLAGLQGDLVSWTDPQDPEAEPLARVPYLYCNDFWSDSGQNCHRWDFGFDVYDRMQDLLQREPLYYLSNNYRRGQISRDAEWFVQYSQERLYTRFKLMHDYYNVIDGICHVYYSPEACEEFMSDPRNGFGTYTVAMHDAFNHLTQTLTRPDAVTYDLLPRGDGSLAYSEAAFASDTAISLPIPEGREFTTTWWNSNYENECGVHFWECLHHHGFYLNKILALLTLGNAETYFMARDSSDDLRSWRISFFDDYADQIIDLVGGIMSEDFSRMAPYLQAPAAGATPELILRNYAQPGDDPIATGRAPADAHPVNPYTGFTLQLYTAVLGFAEMQNNFDNRFITASRMWVCGGDHAAERAGAAPISYEDIETGLAYCAVNRADGQGIAQRMIRHANTLRSRSSFCNEADASAPDACAADMSAEDAGAAEHELHLYRDLLDVMVHLTARYDNWSLSYGDPFNPGAVPR